MCFNKYLMMLMLIKFCGHCDDSTFFSYNIYNKVALRLTMGRKAPKPDSPAVQRAHGTHPTSWALEVSFQISSFFIPLSNDIVGFVHGQSTHAQLFHNFCCTVRRLKLRYFLVLGNLAVITCLCCANIGYTWIYMVESLYPLIIKHS